MMIQHP